MVGISYSEPAAHLGPGRRARGMMGRVTSRAPSCRAVLALAVAVAGR